MTAQKEVDALKGELMGLFHYVQRVRREIAAISRPADEDYHFETMAEQLDAIVKATERATNTIMETAEKNEEILAKLRKTLKDPAQIAMVDQMNENSATIFEACSFQDITGQRVNKVVRSVKYVEERVDALIGIWGKDELDKVDVKPAKVKTEDEKLLHGPQMEGKGLDQAAIDALFD